MKKFVLVDGSSYLFRAYHALPSLTTAKGQATGATFGIIKMLKNLYLDQKPDYFAVVFDARGKTFRHKIYPAYKSNRPPMPEELASQLKQVHKIIRALGLPLLIYPEVEADDVIASLACRAEEKNIATVISTGDKDLAQLVNDRISLIDTMNNRLLDKKGVYQKFAVHPQQMVDFLSLTGDASDNIPGVSKVGPKTAAKWLAEYQTMDNIIANADGFSGKIGENLRGALDILPRNRELITLKKDIDLDEKVEELVSDRPDTATLKKVYRELEFSSWLKELSSEESEKEKDPVRDYAIILDKNDFAALLVKLENSKAFALDTETTSLDVMQAKLVGMSFCLQAGEACYLPLAHDNQEDPDQPRQLDFNFVFAALKPVLENESIKKIGHNLKYDISVLARHGITLKGAIHDTMLMASVLEAGKGGGFDMDTLAKERLGIDTIKYEDVAGKGKKQLGFNRVMIKQAGIYAAEDADVTQKLYDYLLPKLKREPRLFKLYTEIELPLVPVLAQIERNGVFIAKDILAAIGKSFAKQIIQFEQDAYLVAGGKFNLASPKQIREILFDRVKLPVIRKTPKGEPSTAEDVLSELARDYELPEIILKHRELSKLKSTYTDALQEKINAGTGRVHTGYHQAGAITGRLSSSGPNLQNIPVRGENGRLIREAFTAPAGKLLIAADYSQIELRIMAHLSGDDNLIGAFADDIDIHRNTAAEVFGVAPAEVTTAMRSHAKAVNFGLIYGMSAFGLSKQLKIDRSTAQEYIDLYFARYPKVRRYMDECKEFARHNGYVETVFGRRLYLPQIKARNHQRRRYAERTAINAPMQGTAADIIKMAMVKVGKILTDKFNDGLIIMQVHDELVVEAPENFAAEIAQATKNEMEQAASLAVKLKVDAGIGANWKAAH